MNATTPNLAPFTGLLGGLNSQTATASRKPLNVPNRQVSDAHEQIAGHHLFALETLRKVEEDTDLPTAEDVKAIQQALRDCPYSDLRRNVEVGRSDEAICLQGQVDSYFMKQMAQEIAMRTVRGLPLENELEVPIIPAKPR